jgi:N-acetylneuraminic acid mutarotase
MFNPKSQEWHTVNARGRCPEPRAAHSAVVCRDNLIAFGGTNEENERLGDLWVFNFLEEQWSEVPPNIDIRPRSCHSASVVNNDKIVFFGGITGVTKELDDLLLLDTKSMEWKQI